MRYAVVIITQSYTDVIHVDHLHELRKVFHQNGIKQNVIGLLCNKLESSDKVEVTSGNITIMAEQVE